jgi:glutamate synthase domain-containing protein 2
VHQALIERGLRLRASLVVDTDEARDSHQLALLCAFGASAVHPALGYATVIGDGVGNRLDGSSCYRVALERGLLTIMSKMGVCTFSSYCGSQLFEILGLDTAFVASFFPGTPSPIGGATLEDVAVATLERHRRAFQRPASPAAEYPGLHGYRRDGEYHATNPLVVRSLQRARNASHAVARDASEGGSTDGNAYATFTSHVYGRPPAAVRDLLEFAPADAVSIDEVEPVDEICRRFFVSAMSSARSRPKPTGWSRQR